MCFTVRTVPEALGDTSGTVSTAPTAAGAAGVVAVAATAGRSPMAPRRAAAATLAARRCSSAAAARSRMAASAARRVASRGSSSPAAASASDRPAHPKRYATLANAHCVFLSCLQAGGSIGCLSWPLRSCHMQLAVAHVNSPIIQRLLSWPTDCAQALRWIVCRAVPVADVHRSSAEMQWPAGKHLLLACHLT